MIIKDTVLRDFGRLFVWFALRWVVYLSPYRLARMLALGMGTIDYCFCTSRRNQLVRNIRAVLGNDKDVRNTAKGVMQTHYMNLLEFFKFPTIDETNIQEHIFFVGKENLDNALKEGKGVILATLHFGTMQYPLVALGHLGYTINQLGDRDPSAQEFSFIHRKVALRYRLLIEGRLRAKHIHISKTLRPIYKCLQDNELLMINVDGLGGLKGQRLKEDYLKIRFLGNQVYVPAGAARAARKTGAPIIPIVCIRQLDGRHRIVIDQPIPLERSENRDSDIQKNTQRLLSHLENYIRAYPDHWLMWMEFQRGYTIV